MVETAKPLRKAMPAVLRFLISVLFLVVFAGVFTWYILWQQQAGGVEKTMDFICEKPILAAYSYTVILLVMCILTAVTWRPFLTIGLSFALSSILMYINTQKFAYRDAPLLPEDFLLADQTGTIMQFIDPWSVTRLVLGVILVVVGSGIFEYGARKIFGRDTRDKTWWERHSILPRVAWTLVALTGLLMFARPVLHYDDKNGGDQHDWIEGLRFDHWNQKEDYERNGFIVAFLYNLGRFREPEPDGYSEATITEIQEKYSKQADKEKPKNQSFSEVADNVIFVLNESFIDPMILGELYETTGGDITPNLHEIFKKYPSGYMYSPGYGGGTANIEFEALTALSNYWAQTTPYVTSLSKLDTIPGIVNDTVSDGFSATAIHPFDGSMYKRNAVYSRMGFETFLDQNSMSHTRHENNGEYVSDQEAYAEALDILRSDDADKHMVMIATMQNHLPYDAAHYEQFNFKLLNFINDPYSAEAYFETVHNADRYLGEFIAELDKLEEKTVMVWFGDHAPAILEEYMNSGDLELIDLAHLTPYFVYANFELESLDTEVEIAKENEELGFDLPTQGVDLPIVTPNCFMSILHELLGVKKTPLVYLSGEVCKETPILTPAFTRGGELEETEIIKDYRLVNYDILSGKRYWLELE